MAAPKTRLSAGRFLGWPVFVVAAALVVYVVPGANGTLVYDRGAILHGEVWRLVTGHWVHFSPSHLFYDVTVLGISGGLIGARGDRYFPVLCLLAAVAIGSVLLILEPGLAYYGGLSGIAMASTIYLALQALHEPRPWRGAAVAVLLACIAKMVVEQATGHFALVVADPERVVPVPASHLVGAVSGTTVYLWSRIRRWRFAMRPEGIANDAHSSIDLGSANGMARLLEKDS